jgi:hypothetical protein
MRALLAKDLLILRRSRLLVGVLIVYPIAIALLIGLAISRSPGKPKVAVVDQTPPGQTVSVGNRRVPLDAYAQQIFSQVQPVHVASRAQAVKKIEAGEVLAAVVIPANIAARLGTGLRQAQLEVLYNGNALEQSLVHAQIEAALAHANIGFSEEIQRAASQAIGALLSGRNLGALGAPELVGLGKIAPELQAIARRLAPGAERTTLQQIASFASFAAQNLSLAKNVLSTIGQPIKIQTTLISGRRTPLNTFAVVVAVSISLMFVCVLLASGGVALEREENTLARLVRGLTSRARLLLEKALLAAGCSFVLALAMLAGIGAFVSLDWSRIGQWLAALALGAVAFAALGVAIGAIAREVRAASLLAFLLSLPLAFLALVPNGAVGHGLGDAISAISFVFPFKAALQALDAAVNGASPSLAGPLVHLALLSAAFGALAYAGLRRLD